MEAIILAAGASRRMGQDKATLPWGKATVIEHLVEVLQPLSTEIVVVTGLNHQQVAHLLHDRATVRCVPNPQWPTGMFSSIRAGFAAHSGAGPILLQMVDQPHLPESFYQSLLSHWKNDIDALQPVYREGECVRSGHPLLFAPSVRERLTAPGVETLRDVLSSLEERLVRVEMEIPAILQDMDTPDDYRKLRS